MKLQFSSGDRLGQSVEFLNLDDDNLPDVIPWKKLSNTRYLSLLKSMDKISGQVMDDHRQFYASLPHVIETQAKATKQQFHIKLLIVK